ncbi:peptide ABC transporter permease [Clostridium sp. DMHC 10]|uniref:ABC transporter permease n=1 Tax=Clostridium sp. DMHC 10 TaxID=747377 RepID=UPI00069D6501|nr:ABC transporter permease [Clostridium sp. DMHC 10]KOF57608.1 peptide ABC transporter permease [Clostridium sp. DMHC 10]
MKYVLRKGIALIVTLIFVSAFTFAAFNVIPGDPALVMLGTNASPERVEALRKELGLNESLTKRYVTWVANFIRGDFGKSIRFSEPVKDLVSKRIPVTVSLAILSLFIIFIIAIPLSIFAASKEGAIIDTIINIICQINIGIPSFFLGVIIILIFGIVLKVFSPGAYVDYNEDFIGFLKYLIAPAVTIALPNIAVVVKFLRAAVIKEKRKDYVRTAYSKGNKENTVLYVHVLKNALITVITLMGMIIAGILGGSIIVEQIFSLPGIGNLLITAISTRDFPLTQTLVLYLAFIVVVINFLVDVLYQVIDPRIRVR